MPSTLHLTRELVAPGRSFFLFGARGTGKSTWAAAAFPSATRFDLRDEALYLDLLRDPALFPGMLARIPRGSWVVVDEVQRLPALLNEVHRRLDDRTHRFVLLGSSARKLRRAGQNLLGGRAASLSLWPFTPRELAGEFDLQEALTFGTIPLVWADDDRPAALRAYAQAYVRDEVQAEALVRSLPAFTRFLEVAAVMHAQVLNVSALARDAHVQRDTVGGYLQVLEDTLIGYRLPAFDAKLRVRERTHPKWYLFDPGLVRALKRQLGPLSREERGPLFEGLVLHVLRALFAYSPGLDGAVAYWGSDDVEVDFVVTLGKRRVAIDATSAERLHPADFKGLEAIAGLPGLTERLLVYAGSREYESPGGVLVLPFQRFLAHLASLA